VVAQDGLEGTGGADGARLIGSWSKTTSRAGGFASTRDARTAHLQCCERSSTIQFGGEGSGRNSIVRWANQETMVDPLTGGLGAARVTPA
jgi:hypothetical protein